MNQKLLFSSALLVGIAGTQQALAHKKKVQDQKRPNVVFILADDLGFDNSLYRQMHKPSSTISRTQDTRPALSVNGDSVLSVPRVILKNRASTSSMATTASCWHTVIIPIICGTMTNE